MKRIITKAEQEEWEKALDEWGEMLEELENNSVASDDDIYDFDGDDEFQTEDGPSAGPVTKMGGCL